MPLHPDENDLLPPGVHDATLAEVEACFGRFQRSTRRPTLFARLNNYVEELIRAHTLGALYIDGSFAMACVDEPGDIDLILILPADLDLSADLQPFRYNVVSKRMVRQQYKFDLLTAQAGTVSEQEYLEFFGRVNLKWVDSLGLPEGCRKGIVRLAP